ncbi:MAG: electron transfer flavoprotein subunit beta/FixA family protein [Acidimicrobiia bacterium]|nr:electron transfer flavoprotein subunit beta/FixA family protein [Acidimicrobiia bacterium]
MKRVPAPGARINVTADGQAVETAHLGFTTSPHEECAVEEAVQITERMGGEVTVLTVGPPEAEEQLRYAASVGCHRLVLVPTDGSALDPQRTASVITDAVQSLEAEGGEFDLILFGNESADSGGFQVGVRVAHALGRPIVNGIKGIDVESDGLEGHVVARRAVDAGSEVYHLPRPAVLGIKEGINLPRYPTMKGRLASKKADLATMPLDAEAGGQAMVKLHRPAETVKETIILGTSEDAAPAIVDLLEEIGVL